MTETQSTTATRTGTRTDSKTNNDRHFYGELSDVVTGEKRDGKLWLRAKLTLNGSDRPLKIRAFDGVSQYVVDHGLEGKRVHIRCRPTEESFEPEPGNRITYRVYKASFIELAKPRQPRAETASEPVAAEAAPEWDAPSEDPAPVQPDLVDEAGLPFA